MDQRNITYPVLVVFNKDILVGVKIMLVFTVLVSLPNKTCLKQMAPIMSRKRNRHKKLSKYNTKLRRTYPKEADRLGEYGSKQQSTPTTIKNDVRNKRHVTNHLTR